MEPGKTSLIFHFMFLSLLMQIKTYMGVVIFPCSDFYISKRFPWILQIGLVIDLTNSTKYYSPADLKKDGIKYVKVSISLKLEAYV